MITKRISIAKVHPEHIVLFFTGHKMSLPFALLLTALVAASATAKSISKESK